MIKILEEVATRRIKSNSRNFQIQLSSTLMNKAIENVNEIAEKDILAKNEMANEFTYVMHGREFKIFNRAYRDDTNDRDVEEVLYEFAHSSLSE